MSAQSEVVARWHHSANNLSTSGLDFYASIETTIWAKEFPVKLARVRRSERGALSAKREYLEATYQNHTFMLSAFPFGKDFYFGWWLSRKLPGVTLLGCAILLGAAGLMYWRVDVQGPLLGSFTALGILLVLFVFFTGAGGSDVREALSGMPLFGGVYRRFFNPVTYYTEESRLIFEEAIHRVVLDVVDGILTVNQMTPLTDAQKAALRADGL